MQNSHPIHISCLANLSRPAHTSAPPPHACAPAHISATVEGRPQRRGERAEVHSTHSLSPLHFRLPPPHIHTSTPRQGSAETAAAARRRAG
eukprot:196011-Chlamydomonas_euryale.AAC.1